MKPRKKTVFAVFGYTETGADYLVKSFRIRSDAVEFANQKKIENDGRGEWDIKKITY